MELNEYLTQTRNRRMELLKTAQGYLHKTTSNDTRNSPAPIDSEEIYSGPNPQGLRAFESDVGYQLKKIFTPGMNERSQKLSLLSNKSIEEGIKKVYSRRPNKKPKQLVMLPKDHNCGYIKVTARIRKTKNFSVSPDVSAESVNKSFNKIQQEVKSFRKSFHENLLLPVLSVSGSHEYRSKVYKY